MGGVGRRGDQRGSSTARIGKCTRDRYTRPVPETDLSPAPTIAARVRRASLRVVPVLLVAGGIAWWSRSNAIRCERLFERWAGEFERSLLASEPRLPASAQVAAPLLEEPLASALAAGVAAGSPARIEPSEDAGFARVVWRDRAEVSRWIELRCDGAAVVVSGVGLEPPVEGAGDP